MRGGCVSVLVLACLSAVPARADEPFPAPLGRISDYAKVLNPAATARVQQVVDTLLRETGVEMNVVTVFHAGQRTPRDLAHALFEHWGIGKERKGLLVLLVRNDRRLEIEVGPGLETVLPDTVTSDVALLWAGPVFRQGKLDEGLIVGTSELAKRIREGRQTGAIAADPQPDAAEDAAPDEVEEVPADAGRGPMTGFRRSLPGFGWALVVVTTLAGLGLQLSYRFRERVPNLAFLGAGLGPAAFAALLGVLGVYRVWTWSVSAGMIVVTAALGATLWERRCPKCALWMDLATEPAGSGASAGSSRRTTKVYDCRFCGHSYSKQGPAASRRSRGAPSQSTPQTSAFRLTPVQPGSENTPERIGRSRFGGRTKGGFGRTKP